MQATVNMEEVLQELFGLSGFYPEITLNRRMWQFQVVTSLYISDGRNLYDAVTAIDPSADLAVLKAYQTLFEAPARCWIESSTTGYRWKFDPETEGWEKLNG